MAKMHVKIGFVETVETSRGVFTEQENERYYDAEVLRLSKQYENSGYLNDDLNVNNEYSILADPYALEHFHAMRYIELWKQTWKIRSVQVEYPRLKLTIGGVYNGKPRRSSTDS